MTQKEIDEHLFKCKKKIEDILTTNGVSLVSSMHGGVELSINVVAEDTGKTLHDVEINN